MGAPLVSKYPFKQAVFAPRHIGEVAYQILTFRITAWERDA